MKILIAIGMVIVFISAFFIFFIFDTAVRGQIACFTSPEANCGAKEMGAFTTGLMMMAMFLVIDAITVYIIMTTAMSESETF